MNYSRTYYYHNHHHNYHHHACHNHHWSNHHFHLPYPHKPSFNSNKLPSSSSQSLSATARLLNPKCLNVLLNSLTALPKFQTFPASPILPHVFLAQLKTTFVYMSSTEPTKLITSVTRYLFHLKLSTIISAKISITIWCFFSKSISCNISMYSYTSVFSRPTVHPLFYTPASKSRHHLVPHPPSKVLLAAPVSSLYVA